MPSHLHRIYINLALVRTPPYLREYSSSRLKHIPLELARVCTWPAYPFAVASRVSWKRLADGTWRCSIEPVVSVFPSTTSTEKGERPRKQEHTNGCELKNGTTAASASYYSPRRWVLRALHTVVEPSHRPLSHSILYRLSFSILQPSFPFCCRHNLNLCRPDDTRKTYVHYCLSSVPLYPIPISSFFSHFVHSVHSFTHEILLLSFLELFYLLTSVYSSFSLFRGFVLFLFYFVFFSLWIFNPF